MIIGTRDVLIGLLMPMMVWHCVAAQSRASGTPTPIVTMNSAIDSARQLGDDGRADLALGLLTGMARAHPEIPPTTIEHRVATDLIRYRLVGKRAPDIEAPTWINLSPGTTHFDVAGKVTLIAFTAHWCAPCWKSYPMLNAIGEQFAGQVQRVMVTELYGTFDGKPAKSAVEIAADRKYFSEQLTGSYLVAISDQPPPPVVPGTYGTVNTDRYGVEPLPQFVLTDRHGVVRRIIVGQDSTTWAKLPGVLAKLIAEK